MGILELLIVVLLILWLTGMFVFPIGSLVHVLLVVLLVVILVRVLQGRSAL
jgi:hypothetical protein